MISIKSPFTLPNILPLYIEDDFHKVPLLHCPTLTPVGIVVFLVFFFDLEQGGPWLLRMRHVIRVEMTLIAVYAWGGGEINMVTEHRAISTIFVAVSS